MQLLDLSAAEFGEPVAALELRTHHLHLCSGIFDPIEDGSFYYYKENQAKITVEGFFSLADSSLKDAKSCLTWIMKANKQCNVQINDKETTNMMRVCVMASIFLDKLFKAYNEYGKAVNKHVTVKIPAPEERFHKAWIVPSIIINQ